MIRKLTELVIRQTKVQTIIILAAAVIGIEIGFSQLTAAMTAQGGIAILDMSVLYSADFAYERLRSLTEAAKPYFYIRLLDFFFPAVYATALSILSSFIYRRKYETPDSYRWVLAVPFLAAVFDYIENIMLVVLFRLLPAEYPSAIPVLNIFSILKFGLLGLSFLLVITGAFSLLKGGDSVLVMGNKFRGGDKDSQTKED